MGFDNISFLQHIYNLNQNKKTTFPDLIYLKSLTSTVPFKHFDYCSNYSLIVSSSNLIKKCLNCPALFTIIDQKIVHNYLGISYTNVVVLYIKCEYLANDGTHSSYTFKVILDHGSLDAQLINNIVVNSNGTVLLLSSPLACFLVNTPDEISNNSKIEIHQSTAYINDPIYGSLLLKERCSVGDFNVVKAVWNSLYSNTFVLVTNESVPSTRNGSDRYAPQLNSYEHISCIRIFNLDNGFDNPTYQFILSERQCRLGYYSESDLSFKFQSKRGKLVDFFWNSNDLNSLGSLTLFAFSNYGYVFCYCPVIINNICDFNKKLAITKRCNEIVNDGFKPNFGFSENINDSNLQNSNTNGNDDESSELMKFVSNINEYMISNQSNLSFYPIVVRLISEHFVPDCDLIYSYPTYESFVVMSTSPMVILASHTNSRILLYRPDLKLYPNTSCFYNKRLLNKVNICQHKDSIDIASNLKFSFHYLSQWSCLYYSHAVLYQINCKNKLNYKPLFKLDGGSSDLDMISSPILVESNTTKLCFAGFNSPSSILIAHKFIFGTHSDSSVSNSMLIHKFIDGVTFDSSDDLDDSIIKSMSLSSFEQSQNQPLQTIQPNSDIFNNIKTIRNTVNNYKEIFKELRGFNEKKNLNEKAVDIMKTLSRLNSDVISNLESMSLYEKALDEYVNVNDRILFLFDKFFNETIDQYHSIFNEIKETIAEIKERHKSIDKRRSEFIKTLDSYNGRKRGDDIKDHLTNMVTEFNLRFSNIILNKLEENVNGSQYNQDYESKKQQMIDEWFHDTLKDNVDLMYKLSTKIKTLRASIDTMS